MHLEGREGWELGLLGLREEGLDAQISESGGREYPRILPLE